MALFSVIDLCARQGYFRASAGKRRETLWISVALPVVSSKVTTVPMRAVVPVATGKRMGIPVREYGLSLISVAICADNDRISALSGKLGRLRGVNAKVTYSNVSVQA